MKNYFIKIISFSSLMVFMSSCAMLYDPTVVKPASYIKPTSVSKNFDISGRFNIKTNEKNSYGNFIWTRQDDRENLELRSPIGTAVAKITIESSVVKLRTKDNAYIGRDVDRMLEANLGFTLPIHLLHYWVQGVALPNIPVDRKLYDGFVQLGWKIEYLSWAEPNHPKILLFSRGGVSIKLLIEW